MNRGLYCLSLLPLLTGCSSVAGVWMIVIPYQEDATTCTTTLAENFIDGYQPTDGVIPGDDDWTYTKDHTGSDTLLFVQVETTVGGEAVLVMGNEAYPGLKEGKSWVFTWSDSVEDSVGAEHVLGYHYDATSSYVETSTMTLSTEGLGGDSGTGTFSQEAEAVDSYVESDAWDEEMRALIGTTGQIPSEDYLVYDDGDDQLPQQNTWDEADCTADCSLTITSTCSGSSNFTAVRADYADEDAFDYLRGTTNGG